MTTTMFRSAQTIIGHYYKNFQNKVTYSEGTIHTTGSHMCYNNLQIFWRDTSYDTTGFCIK
jgi:hypothetical protein